MSSPPVQPIVKDRSSGDRLRVAVDATSLLDRLTGVGVFVQELLAGLGALPEERGIDVSTFAVSWRGRQRLADAVPAGVGVLSRPVPARLARPLWARGMGPEASWLGGACDVVHGPNHVVPPDSQAAEVVTVHDLTALRYPEMCTPDVLRWPQLLTRSVKRGAWIHTPTEAVAEEVRERWPMAADRVVAIHHGVTAPAPEQPETSAAAGRRLAGAEQYVLALGTVEPRKDLPTLVAAFDRIAAANPKLVLVVAGPDGWGTDEFLAARDAAVNRGRIRRLGWVNQDQRSALLRGATVLAYPSVYEGFGFVPLEALSVGTPVVASRLASIEEVTGDAALLVAAGDPDALAQALTAVIDGSDDAPARMRTAEAVLADLTWPRAITEFLDLYRRAARLR